MVKFEEFISESDVTKSLEISIFDMTFSQKSADVAKKISKTLKPDSPKADIDAAVAEAVKTSTKKSRASTDIRNALIKNHGFPKSIQGIKEPE